MSIISDLSSNPMALGIIIVLSLIALASKELVMIRGPVSHKNLYIFLNVSIVITIVLFIYVFARIAMNILSGQ